MIKKRLKNLNNTPMIAKPETIAPKTERPCRKKKLHRVSDGI